MPSLALGMNLLQHLLPAGWVGNSVRRLLIAVVVTLAFTVLARLLRGVSATGAIAGSLICLLIFVSTGPAGFAMLASVFILAWVSTRIGYLRKQRMGTAEKRDGRKASQVLANLSIAAVCGLLYGVSGHAAFLVASAAALAEPAADTVSSEVGQARSEVARLITTGERVPAGANGGITFVGSSAGVVAALLVGLVGAAGGLIPRGALWATVVAGTLGMIADSYLGAVFEGRNLNNDAVNFLGTLCAALAGATAWRLTAGS